MMKIKAVIETSTNSPGNVSIRGICGRGIKPELTKAGFVKGDNVTIERTADIPTPAADPWEPIAELIPEPGCSYIVANTYDYNIAYYSGYGGFTLSNDHANTFAFDEIKKRFLKFTRINLLEVE